MQTSFSWFTCPCAISVSLNMQLRNLAPHKGKKIKQRSARRKREENRIYETGTKETSIRSKGTDKCLRYFKVGLGHAVYESRTFSAPD